MGRKLILGLSAALVVALWGLCAVVYAVRSRTGSYDGAALAPFIVLAALFTAVAGAHGMVAWRRGAKMGAAALTLVFAAAAVFGLLIALSLPGG